MAEPSRNQTIIAVPPDLDTPERVKIFLTNLVIQLDILLGLRAGQPSTEEELAGVIPAIEEFSDVEQLMAVLCSRISFVQSRLTKLQRELANTESIEDLIQLIQVNALSLVSTEKKLVKEIKDRQTFEQYYHGN